MPCEINATINQNEISAEIQNSEIAASINKNEISASINKNEIAASINKNEISASFEKTAQFVNNVGGNDTEIQFNDSGAFGGNSNFTINKTTGIVTFGKFALTPNSAPTNDYEVANKKYVDDSSPSIIWGGITGTLSNQTDLQSALDSKLALAGGTMTGFLTLNSAPTSNLHASTKKYVDDQVSAIDLSNYFNKTTDDLDDITDGTTYVKSENNFTDILRTKLDGIEAGAEVNNIDNGTTAGQMAFWNGSKWTYIDTSNLIWDSTNNKLKIKNILITEDLKNYNPDLIDIGAEQVNDVRGYGDDYVAEKTLSYCRVGGSANEEEGAIRVSNSVYQIYLNGVWEDVVTGFRFREDDNGAYELEHKPISFTWWIEVSSGNSDKLGLNGLPLAQNYLASMGAYPVPLELDGGTF